MLSTLKYIEIHQNNRIIQLPLLEGTSVLKEYIDNNLNELNIEADTTGINITYFLTDINSASITFYRDQAFKNNIALTSKINNKVYLVLDTNNKDEKIQLSDLISLLSMSANKNRVDNIYSNVEYVKFSVETFHYNISLKEDDSYALLTIRFKEI